MHVSKAALLQLAGLALIAAALGMVAPWAGVGAFGIGLIALGVALELELGARARWLRPPDEADHAAASWSIAEQMARRARRSA